MSYCGVPAAQVVQDYLLWEIVLNNNPQITGIVELGTWEGGFSLYLHQQAMQRDLMFRTYDVIQPKRQIPGFCKIDIFAEADSIGEHLMRHDPLVLLCDGGNKPRELKTFYRYLSSESRIVVHDWMTEFMPTDIPEDVEMVYGDFCEQIDSMSRVFQVVEV